jgi:hypothetical protein
MTSPPRVLLNDHELPLPHQAPLLGDLLREIEQQSSRRGEVVTAVRIDGVSEPAFRVPETATRPMASIREVQICTAPLRKVLGDLLAQSSAGATALSTAAADIARALRRGDRHEAVARLADLIAGIHSLGTVFDTVRGAADDLRDDAPAATAFERLATQCEALERSCRSGSWIAAAGILKSLQPALRDSASALAVLRSRLDTTPARFAAVCCVYDDDTWLAATIESIYNACDAIWFLVSDTPWNGQAADQTALLDHIRALPDPDGKIRIERGRWRDEASQRNDGLRLLGEAGIEYCLVVDADEIYDTDQLRAAMAIVRQHPHIDCWRLSCFTYWKSCRYRVDPPEAIAAPVFIRTGSGRFVENRNYEAPRQMQFPPETIAFHHMSYARTDAQILRKISTWGHATQVVPGWYENVWRKWDHDHSLRNLNPCWPSAYQTIVEQPLDALPPVVRRLLSLERDALIGA